MSGFCSNEARLDQLLIYVIFICLVVYSFCQWHYFILLLIKFLFDLLFCLLPQRWRLLFFMKLKNWCCLINMWKFKFSKLLVCVYNRLCYFHIVSVFTALIKHQTLFIDIAVSIFFRFSCVKLWTRHYVDFIGCTLKIC